MLFFTNHHRPYHRAQKQYTAYFKRHDVGAEQFFSKCLYQSDVAGCDASFLLSEFCILQCCNQHQQQTTSRNSSSELEPFVLLRFHGLAEIHQHDHEQEQHHDGACVHDYVYDCEELRVE